MTRGRVLAVGLLLAVALVAAAVMGWRASRPPPPNLLVVVLDDLGIEALAAYGATGPDVARTPTLDALAADGVTFDRFYADPVCSPTRYTLLSGRHARRVGLGLYLRPRTGFEVPLDEVLLPEVLRDAPTRYDTSLAGKWHLATYVSPSGADHPALQGFAWHAGPLGNLTEPVPGGLPAEGYHRWTKDDNGAVLARTTYATTDTTDDAIARVAAMTEPWLLWVAYNAPHLPFDPPPPHLRGDRPADGVRSVLEALDQELGRLFASLDPDTRARTVIVALSDNGPDEPLDPALATGDGLTARGKGTTTESGVRVPLIVAGPGIPRGARATALVQSVDLLPTLAELAGVTHLPRPVDGSSFAAVLADPAAPGPRRTVYVEHFGPNGPPPYNIDRRALRDDRYKLERVGSAERFYDLAADPMGERPLDPTDPEARAARDRLAAELDALAASLTYEGP